MKYRALRAVAMAAFLLPGLSYGQSEPDAGLAAGPAPGAAAAPAAIPAAAAPAGRVAAVVSPEIGGDGRVTFRLRAPNATAVAVTGLAAPLSMTKDAQGVWSATTDTALKPDIYIYNFTVDGLRVTDPSNVGSAFLVAPSKTASQLVVPGVPWTAGDVPHGAVSHHIYKSSIIGADEEYFVYTPPGYDPKRKKPYPVFFLLHGLGDNASDWIGQGGANLSLDALIAKGKALPMILITPASYGNSSGTRGAAAGFPAFTDALIKEILPQVESQYNASKRANDHAISGLSMGAAQSPLLLNHLDQFAWIGEFSPGFDMYARINTPLNAPGGAGGAPGPGGAGGAGAAAGGGRGAAPGLTIDGVRMRATLADNVIPSLFPNLTAKDNAKIKLLYLACGTNDDHLALQRQFKEFLDSRGIKITVYQEVPGYAHEWPFWRYEVTQFAPLLFKS